MKTARVVIAILVVVIACSGGVLAQDAKGLYTAPLSNTSLIEQSIFDYLKAERVDTQPEKPAGFSIIALFKSKAFAAPQDKDLERKRIREEWKEFLGLDVFYPYFKGKEIQERVQEKTKVRLMNMRGRAEFDEEGQEFRYIFKRKF
jgi:hypothetical protein